MKEENLAMSRLRKNNFVNGVGQNHNNEYLERDLEKILSNTLNYYDKNAQDFDFEMINIKELKTLIEVFKKHTVYDYSRQTSLSFQRILEYVETSLNDAFVAIIYFKNFNDHIELNFHETQFRKGYGMGSLIFNVSKIFAQIEHSVIAIKNLISIRSSLIANNDYDEYQIIERLITIFHEFDFILEMNLKAYLFLKEYSIMWWKTIDLYESDYEKNSEIIIQNRFKELLSEIIRKYDLKISLENENFGYNYKKPFYQVLLSTKRIIYWLINYKINIMNDLIYEKSKQRISNEVFNICYNYFKRFYKLSILHNELINDYYVRTKIDLPGNNSYNSDYEKKYEEFIVPSYLIKLHNASKYTTKKVTSVLETKRFDRWNIELLRQLGPCKPQILFDIF